MRELMLAVSGPMQDGTVRVILSQNGCVLMEDALKIGREPSARDYAEALRFFADQVAAFDETQAKK